MNDDTKIQVLMIYFRHWGNDEIRIRKSTQGIQKTDAIFHECFHNLHTMDMSKHSFWVSLVESLLPGMNHYLPYDDLGDVQILYKRIRFTNDIGTTFFTIHARNVSEEQMRRINAIVAFPVS